MTPTVGWSVLALAQTVTELGSCWSGFTLFEVVSNDWKKTTVGCMALCRCLTYNYSRTYEQKKL